MNDDTINIATRRGEGKTRVDRVWGRTMASTEGAGCYCTRF